MGLPAGFTFSQASLQDYSDCPRRFQLRYVLGVRWPSADAQLSTWEKRAQQGAAFHRLVHQHTVGIPEAALTASITDPELRVWWRAYLDTPPPGLPSEVRRSEVRLSVLLDVHPDVLVADPPRSGLGRATLEGIQTLGPRSIAYISCDPATLGRDARFLVEMGYRLQQITPFDLFPQTYHIESISIWGR